MGSPRLTGCTTHSAWAGHTGDLLTASSVVPRSSECKYKALEFPFAPILTCYLRLLLSTLADVADYLSPQNTGAKAPKQSLRLFSRHRFVVLALHDVRAPPQKDTAKMRVVELRCLQKKMDVRCRRRDDVCDAARRLGCTMCSPGPESGTSTRKAPGSSTQPEVGDTCKKVTRRNLMCSSA